jgi:endonuclease
MGTGLRLYEEEGITGVEFPVGRRFIDILAVDKDGRYVVVELKVSRVRPGCGSALAMHELD